MGLGAIASRSGVLGKLLSKGNTIDSPLADSSNEEEIPNIAPGSPLPGAPKELPPSVAQIDSMSSDPTAHDDENENSDTSPVVTKPDVLAHLPKTFSPSPDTPYPSHDDSDDLGSQHELPYGGGEGSDATATASATAPSALDTARQRLTDFDKPATTKQKILRSLVMAAPIVAGGLVGATDNGVERVMGEQSRLRQTKRAGLEQDVTREEGAQEKAREFDSRQAATNLAREQMNDNRKTMHQDREMKASTMTRELNGRTMGYNPDTQAYDRDMGPAKPPTTKPIHLLKEGGKTIGATDEQGQSWSNDDPALPENLKGILTKAGTQDAANQAAAQKVADEHFANQVKLQENAAVNIATRQRAGFAHQDDEKAKKLIADQSLKEANLSMAEAAYKTHNPVNDNTLVMEYIRHTLPNGSRMTNTELQAAWQARKLDDYALNYMDAHFNHELTQDQRDAMITGVRTAVGATRQAAANAAAVYGGGSADGGRQFQGGATAPQGQGGGEAPEGTRVPVTGGGFKVKKAGKWVKE